MKNSREFLTVLYQSILAGIMISIGGTVYLAGENKVVGAALFTIGLYVICCYGFQLFTGKIGYLVNRGPSYLPELGVILGGNLIGTLSTGLLIRATRLAEVVEKAVHVSEIKLGDHLLSIFILACFCGALMYLGVDGFKCADNPLGRYLGLFLSVMVFILSGFEHCIANMFYFSLAGVWSLRAVLYTAVMVLGNAAGAMFFSFLKLQIAKQQKV